MYIKIKHLLFIQGGGYGGYEADKALVVSLQENLGKEYEIAYPEIKSDEALPDYGWSQQIGEAISRMQQDFILLGHSFGASMILKYLSENASSKTMQGIFLLATPFWSGKEDWQAGLKLSEDFADKLPAQVPLFLYHCKDDEEVPFAQFGQYKKRLAKANYREIATGGHLFVNSLARIATDIRSL
jgi:predicted alpha/beta hydrolase family esterase